MPATKIKLSPNVWRNAVVLPANTDTEEPYEVSLEEAECRLNTAFESAEWDHDHANAYYTDPNGTHHGRPEGDSIRIVLWPANVSDDWGCDEPPVTVKQALPGITYQTREQFLRSHHKARILNGWPEPCLPDCPACKEKTNG